MEYRLISSIEEIKNFQKDLGDCTEINLDTETTGLDRFSSEVILIQVCLNENVYIFNRRKLGDRYSKYIIELLESSGKECIMHNAKFDMQMIYNNFGVILNKVYCTML